MGRALKAPVTVAASGGRNRETEVQIRDGDCFHCVPFVSVWIFFLTMCMLLPIHKNILANNKNFIIKRRKQEMPT